MGLLSFADNLDKRQSINKDTVKFILSKLVGIPIGAAVIRAGGFVSLFEAIRNGFFVANLGTQGTIASLVVGGIAKSIVVSLSFGVGFFSGDYIGAYLDTIVDDGGFGSEFLEFLMFGSGQYNYDRENRVFKIGQSCPL